MSKINIELKLKDLYAIKHFLEKNIEDKFGRLDYIVFLEENEFDDKIKSEEYFAKTKGQLKKDIEHEKGIVDYVVGVISKYKRTEEHYSKEVTPKLCRDCDYFNEDCVRCEKGIQMACSYFKDKN